MEIASCESGALQACSLAGKAAVMPHIEPYGVCIHACSGCSGDYEDPERTAWRNAAEEEADDEERAANVLRLVDREEFPVREE